MWRLHIEPNGFGSRLLGIDVGLIPAIDYISIGDATWIHYVFDLCVGRCKYAAMCSVLIVWVQDRRGRRWLDGGMIRFSVEIITKQRP